MNEAGTAVEIPSGISLDGLSSAEARARALQSQPNATEPPPGRTTREILARNAFNWLNLILVTLGVATLATGSLPDAAFLLVAVINTVVGTVQELRAKRTLDNLALINAPVARARRDGKVTAIPVEQLVLDDVVELRTGEQVGADSVVGSGQAEVDESLVSGEAGPVPKGPGDPLISGTWLVSGALVTRVTAVGADSYASRLAGEARRYSLSGSELVGSVNRVLRWLSVLMLVIGPVLLWSQLQVQDWRSAVRATTAGLVGMVPEGLVLLTTLAFFSAAVRLSRRRVLVQELPAVESLARVDELCTDKTGTLTEGHVAWGDLVLPTAVAGARADSAGTDRHGGLEEEVAGDGAAGDGALGSRTLPSRAVIEAALGALAAGQENNATMAAIRSAPGIRQAPGWDAVQTVEFNSARKWSGVSFARQGTWVLGAAEMITARDPSGLRSAASDLAASGRRVLVVANGRQALAGTTLPGDLTLVAAVELREQVRSDARATLAYFAAQNVTVRVVSGDSAQTVGAVATEVGLPSGDDPVDARYWPEDPSRRDEVVRSHTVFGRVTPDQKRVLVDSLRRQGHVIAMTGDGVNDTLALKDADLGIAMGTGSQVAKAVAQLVLLDDQFEALPVVVAEGRQVLHNIERVASLFLVKNVYSLIISVAVAVAGWPYPFLPRQLTLVSGLAIGIPGFFLAFAPSEERFRPGFLGRVLRFSIPAGAVTAVAVLLSYAGARALNSDPDESRVAAVVTVMMVSLAVLVTQARPLRAWKMGLVAAMAGLFVAAFLVPGVSHFFALDDWPPSAALLQAIAYGAGASAIVFVISHFASQDHKPHAAVTPG
jgi:cation-transporting P-type ATPase E